ncbi:hypothetical protein ONS95_009036 [Cadophora gregata]|uniref:uncharacterized protein n=1 Tax=Cadophora gregata TaxID=51156 RepID=UPI0026DBDD24|nr:uncharacterized protein ONS95_009036 [Cadophora gregata]KAK0124050.1 hypothetical protein ONS95_009036 [Cadophora gregata]
MSTFRGVMEGFEDIRVDYFRPTSGLPNPRACFLSHVHSDHLQGLESKLWRTSPIYCSPATREILLRLETKKNRIGYETKVLEARKVQYRHLEKLLKPIPLDTPTEIELKPSIKLQVTLFDANHCTGAVMFLFELDGTAVLYTGDIRSDPWFVNSLSRNPLLIEYTSGLKTLDCVYLDTSNTVPRVFPSKADGLKELVEKVLQYPQDTVFHFTAWTYGYEEVWMALSKALKSQIHVSKYAYGVYKSLRGETWDKKGQFTNFPIHEGAALTGYTCGNGFQSGCLTVNPNVRLHSCEKGIGCPLLNDKTVWIQPIVRRREDGTDEAEPAVVQAGNDLSGCPQIEFDGDVCIDQLMPLFSGANNSVMRDVKELLSKVLDTPGRVLSLAEFGSDGEDSNVSLAQLAAAVIRAVTEQQRNDLITSREKGKSQSLPKVITFPYSRHSSYEELCELLKIFKPKDVWPCTEDPYYWHEVGMSIKDLFGHECSEAIFRYDREMSQKVSQAASRHVHIQSQTTASSQLSAPSVSPPSKKIAYLATSTAEAEDERTSRSWLMDVDDEDAPTSPIMTNSVELSARSGTKLINRNGQGLLRPFDAQGSEIDVASRAPESIPEVLSSSRRKSNFTDLGTPLKRSRLSLDDSESSPTGILAGQKCNPYTISSDDSDRDNPDTPESDANSEESQEGKDEITFFDPVDAIFRCKACEHEVLGGEHGVCTGCDQSALDFPYIEEAPGGAGPLPQIALDEYTDEVVVESTVIKELVGDCLDYDSSAYDSQDSAAKLEEQYENNSFINDEDIPEPESEEESDSSSGEVDWEAKFKELQNQHLGLQNNFNDLAVRHYEFRKEILGSDMSSEADDDDVDEDDFDEDGMLIVEVTPPDPIATDIVLSQAGEQSQDSEVTEERIRDRVEAFEAARDGGWHEMSLASVSGNHTYAEIEL